MSNLPSKLGNSNLCTQSKPTLWYVHVQNRNKFVDGTAWELRLYLTLKQHWNETCPRNGDLVYTIYTKHSKKTQVWSGNRLFLPWWWMSPQSDHAQQELPAWGSRNLHCRVGQIPPVLRASFWPHIAGSDLSGPACLARGDIHSAQCHQLDGPERESEMTDDNKEDEGRRWGRKMREEDEGGRWGRKMRYKSEGWIFHFHQ